MPGQKEPIPDNETKNFHYREATRTVNAAGTHNFYFEVYKSSIANLDCWVKHKMPNADPTDWVQRTTKSVPPGGGTVDWDVIIPADAEWCEAKVSDGTDIHLRLEKAEGDDFQLFDADHFTSSQDPALGFLRARYKVGWNKPNAKLCLTTQPGTDCTVPGIATPDPSSGLWSTQFAFSCPPNGNANVFEFILKRSATPGGPTVETKRLQYTVDDGCTTSNE